MTDAGPSSKVAYRDEILRRLDARNAKVRPIEKIFKNYARMAEDLAKSKQLSSRSRSVSDAIGVSSSYDVQKLQDELNTLYKQKSLNDQELINANRKLADSESRLMKITDERDKLKYDIDKTFARIAELEHNYKRAVDDNREMQDERLALTASVKVLSDKLVEKENEEIRLIHKIRELNEQRASFMNEELAQQQVRQQKIIQEQIANAIADTTRDDRANSLVGNDLGSMGNMMLGDRVPTSVQSKFESHDGEVTTVLWLTADQFATAGSDRKIRLWNVAANGKQTLTATLAGMNQTATRLDYNPESRELLASSNDNCVRIWNAENQRLMYTFTGHTDKVTSARFYQNHQAVSGSCDRSIKIWDLKSQRCVRSFFPGSTIHDITGQSRFGDSGFFSGHFDKKIRLWDGRTDQHVNIIEMAGKVTSLNLSLDGNYLLCSTRDDTLSLLDVRTLKTAHLYSSEQFHTSYDLSRCVLSPGMEYCAAGSSDGHVYIWNIQTTRIEKVLTKGGHEHAVLSVDWNPSGRGILSGDKQKTVVFWT